MGLPYFAHLRGLLILLPELLLRCAARHAKDGKGTKRFSKSHYTRGSKSARSGNSLPKSAAL